MTAGVTMGDDKVTAGGVSSDGLEFAEAVTVDGGVGLESDPDVSSVASTVILDVVTITSGLAGIVLTETSVLGNATDEAGTDDALDLLRLGGIFPTKNSQCPDSVTPSNSETNCRGAPSA